jgi:hypothetical protein
MKRASFCKVVLVLFIFVVNTCCGCTTKDRSTDPTTREAADGQTEPRVLPADIHNSLLKYILSDRRVEACRQLFSARMLGESPAASFTVEGRNRNGALASVTVLVFLGPDSTSAGLLAFIQGNEHPRVRSCVARSRNGKAFSEDASLELTEYKVAEDGRLTPFGCAYVDSTGEQERGGFWDCVGTSAVAGTLLCILKCLPAGPLYAECLVGCAGLAIAAALVGCAFAELFNSSE